MKHIYLSLLFINLGIQGYSQTKVLTSEEAFSSYKQISAAMNMSFPKDQYETYKRASYSDEKLETYLSQHFKCLDLLPLIKGQYCLKLDSYLHSGNWFREIGFPKESIKSYKEFFSYYKENEKYLTPTEKHKFIEMRSYAYAILADNYAKVSYLDSAALQHKTNIKFTKQFNIISYPSAINNYGIFLFQNKKKADSALVYFKEAYKITKNKFPQHTLLGSIRDNIADIYVNNEQLEKAKPLYKVNFDFFKQAINEKSYTKDIPRLISAGSQYIVTSLKLGDLKDAETVYLPLVRIVHNNTNIVATLPNSELEFLKAKELLFTAQNNSKAAYETSKSIRQISDSLKVEETKIDKEWQEQHNTIALGRVKLKFEIDRIQNENKIKNQRLNLWIITLTSSSILILLLSLFLRRRQHLLNAKNKQLLAEQTLENTALKVEQLNSEIKSKERDLSDFAINLTHHQKWAEVLADKIGIIKVAKTKNQHELLLDLEQEIKNKITFDVGTKVFFERLDKLSDLFYNELSKSFPNLSKNEIRLCSLIRLKMDSRNIATLQNITLASLNTSRYRLRKKLGLSEAIDLDGFIQHL
ncbi:hypothetical protein I2486_19425 [Cellulophaga sp. E16_2]|uniref:helix-turn-helix transcriptional regulator n=1 Tax=unclassified Cellulophaga TaxID=2634405 RepID=UPI0013FDDDCB|nr:MULTISPECIES: hypothetical protein [unclassified Cellulophaga]MBO0593575.1 hypothetical protein [Cellulophaga sp. E16_2]